MAGMRVWGLFDRDRVATGNAVVGRPGIRLPLPALSRSTPMLMDPGFQDALELGAERNAPGMHIRMPSGAGHDAMIVARRLPAYGH